MIAFDRKILRVIKKFSKDLDEPLLFWENGIGVFEFTTGKVRRFDKNGINPKLAKESIKRLVNEGYLEYYPKTGGVFHITSKTILSHQFWWDNFSQKFWNGFWAGFASAIATAIVTAGISNLLGLWSIL